MSTALALRTEDVTAFAKAAEWTGARSTDRRAWLGLRRTMVTASDVAAVLGVDDDVKRSAISVYVDKVLDQEPEVITIDDPRFWGAGLEQTILRLASDYYGWQYREGGYLLRSRQSPCLGATLDAEIDRGDGVWIDLEGKTSQVTKHWNEETGALPTGILIQVQSQLLVTGAPIAIVFALLVGCRPVQIIIEPDAELHSIIVEQSEQFIDQVRRLDPPPPCWRESATEALHRLYPAGNDSVVDLPKEAVEWTRELHAIAEEIKKLDRRDKEIRNLLRFKIGSATYGRLAEPVDGKECWRWAKNKAAQRVLLMLKSLPFGTRPYGSNRAAADGDALTAALEASLKEDDDDNGDEAAPAAPIRMPTKRRRSRR